MQVFVIFRFPSGIRHVCLGFLCLPQYSISSLIQHRSKGTETSHLCSFLIHYSTNSVFITAPCLWRGPVVNNLNPFLLFWAHSQCQEVTLHCNLQCLSFPKQVSLSTLLPWMQLRGIVAKHAYCLKSNISTRWFRGHFPWSLTMLGEMTARHLLRRWNYCWSYWHGTKHLRQRDTLKTLHLLTIERNGFETKPKVSDTYAMNISVLPLVLRLMGTPTHVDLLNSIIPR